MRHVNQINSPKAFSLAGAQLAILQVRRPNPFQHKPPGATYSLQATAASREGRANARGATNATPWAQVFHFTLISQGDSASHFHGSISYHTPEVRENSKKKWKSITASYCECYYLYIGPSLPWHGTDTYRTISIARSAVSATLQLNQLNQRASSAANVELGTSTQIGQISHFIGISS
jgi:hypothetical protein